jgi:hypothetical protein
MILLILIILTGFLIPKTSVELHKGLKPKEYFNKMNKTTNQYNYEQ